MTVMTCFGHDSHVTDARILACRRRSHRRATPPSSGFRRGGSISSERLGWRSTLVRAYADPDEADGFTTAPTPDLLVVINASGTFTIESGRSRARYRPGSAGVTTPYRSAGF